MNTCAHYICIIKSKTMEHTQDSAHTEDNKGLWYTYFGETGASVVAFIYILIIFSCIYSFLRWG